MTYNANLWCLLPICIPDILELVLTAIANTSITKLNNKGERVQPCLAPPKIWILEEVKAFHTTVCLRYNKFIHCENNTPSPHFSATPLIKSHSTLSNAFSESIK